MQPWAQGLGARLVNLRWDAILSTPFTRIMHFARAACTLWRFEHSFTPLAPMFDMSKRTCVRLPTNYFIELLKNQLLTYLCQAWA